jgi:hypothetical protein
MYRIKRGGKSGIACEQFVLDARRAIETGKFETRGQAVEAGRSPDQ